MSINKYLLAIVVILLLVCYISIDGCRKQKIENEELLKKSDTIDIRIDTFYAPIVHDTIKIPDPNLVSERNPKSSNGKILIPKDYIPKSDYDSLLLQYNYLLEEFFAQREYLDTAKLDSAWASIRSYISANRLDSIGVIFGGKLPEITRTITIEKQQKEKFKFYYGFDLSSNFTFDRLRLDIGVILKNRKDNLLKINIGKDTKGETYGELGLYVNPFRR